MALTPEQKQWRIGRITSSVAAGCLGLNPYCSPLQAWESIMGISTFSGNDATEAGDVYEPALTRWCAEKMCLVDLELSPSSVELYEWSGCHVDGIAKCPVTGEQVLIEAKTAGYDATEHFGENFTDRIPYHYYIQCQWHFLHYPNASICYVPAGLVPRRHALRIYVIKRNRELIDNIVKELEIFVDSYIKTGVAPEVRKKGRLWRVIQ